VAFFFVVINGTLKVLFISVIIVQHALEVLSINTAIVFGYALHINV
jgi:hypothetical protein